MRFALSAATFALCFLASLSTIVAIVDPTAVPNNRFGIHIVSEADLANAARLVNGNGGQWGYVSLVIRQDERDPGRWQKVFLELNKNKLIPIIRLATRSKNNNWIKPTTNEAGDWADFLNQLPWPVKNRYVIIFNEPNHAKEWDGQINPAEYAEILKTYSDTLKHKNADFFILPAGLDASAANITGQTMDEVNFLTQAVAAQPDYFNFIDGWASHSYPQPNFQGPASATGRGSVGTFDWELSLLKKLGLERSLPVFITETGWRKNGYSQAKLEQLYLDAFRVAWNRIDVAAVTPFLLNYQSAPFADFSWQIQDSQEFLSHYDTIKNLPKTAGRPRQDHGLEFITPLPADLAADSNYSLDILLKNTGQSIIQTEDEFVFKSSAGAKIMVNRLSFDPIFPQHQGLLNLNLRTDPQPGEAKLAVWLTKDNQPVGNTNESLINILALPDLQVSAKIGLANRTPDRFFILTIYPPGQPSRQLRGSLADQSSLAQIHDLVFKQPYPVELKVTGCLPKRLSWTPVPGLNQLDFGRIWPVDLNDNGQLDLGDLRLLVINPALLKQLL